MTLYLCKLDPNVKGEPKFIGVIGRIVETSAVGATTRIDGYRFLPNCTTHKASRKIWPSANACIPKWTERCGFLRLLEHHELPR